MKCCIMQYFKFIILYYMLLTLDSISSESNIYEQFSSSIQDLDFVDPNILYFNHQPQAVKILDREENHNSVIRYEDHSTNCPLSPFEVFSRRLINILIAKLNIKINNGIAIGQLDFNATIEELEIFKGFGEGKVSIRQIDSIIHNVIQPTQTNLFDEALSFADRFSIYIYQHRIIFGATLLIIFVIIIALKVKWTRWRVILLIIDIMFIISFMLTWWELLQESEIKLRAQQQIYSNLPDECRQDEIEFFKSVLLFFGFNKGNCYKYYQATMEDPQLKVTPLVVFSHMMTKFIFHPIALAGSYLSDFIENITCNLFFPLNHIAKLILILLVPFSVVMLLFIALGASTGIKLGPFWQIYFHAKQSAPSTNSIINDRQVIEVVQLVSNEAAVSPPEIKKDLFIIKKVSKKENSSRTYKNKIIKYDENQLKDNSDGNSEEFPEEKEYEKMSRKNLEDEINQLKSVKNTEEMNNENLKSENKNSQNDLKTKIKNSLEIGCGDN